MRLRRRELAARAAAGWGLAHLALHLRGRGPLLTGHVTVLAYHRVVRPEPPPEPLALQELHVTAELFDEQLAILKRFFTLIDTRDLDAHARGEPLPRNPAMITFDDGYRDNHDEALPILRRHGARATFFISTGYVTERRVFWWDRLQDVVARARPGRFTLALPEPLILELTTGSSRQAALLALLGVVKQRPGLDVDRFLDETASACGVRLEAGEEERQASDLVMTWDHVRALHQAGMDVQSHSRSHRVLTTLSDADAEADLLAARRELERHLDKPVVAVAYPSGRPPLRIEVVRNAGYRLGFTSGTGVAQLGEVLDPFRIPRLAVTRLYGPQFFRGLLAFPSLSYRSRRPDDDLADPARR